MIFLVRHGEAEAGWGHAADPGLSELGHKQAETAAGALKLQDIRHIVASPMARCQQTCAPFAQLSGLEAMTDPDVSEIPTPDGLDDRVAWLRGFMGGDWKAAPPVLHDWREKLLAKANSFSDHTVVFSHFIAINTIVGSLQGSEAVTSFRPGHCSVTQLIKGAGGLSIESLGSEAASQVL